MQSNQHYILAINVQIIILLVKIVVINLKKIYNLKH